MFSLSALFVLMVICLSSGETILNGLPAELNISKSGNPYIVNDNLVIPAGKQLTINKGCVFLFKPFTGIIVEGSLIVNGTSEEPVVFTSFNSSAYNPSSDQLPNPFDWNGILITMAASKVQLNDFILEYSVYGIKSQKEDLTINRGVFYNNGQFNFATRDAIQPVVEKIPFNYRPLTLSEETKPLVKTRPPNRQLPLGIGLGVIGAVAWIISGYAIYSYSSDIDNYRRSIDQRDIDKYYGRAQKMKAFAIVSGITGTITFTPGVVFIVRSAKKKSVAGGAFKLDISCFPCYGRNR